MSYSLGVMPCWRLIRSPRRARELWGDSSECALSWVILAAARARVPPDNFFPAEIILAENYYFDSSAAGEGCGKSIRAV